MIKRRVFYSFHFDADSWRAATVRNIGMVEGNRPATDQKWEEVARGGDEAIMKWINEQMMHRSCALVLVGAQTAGRRWIDYEIREAWTHQKGLAGIHIHGLLDNFGYESHMGRNPFAHFTVADKHGNRYPLNSVIKCYNPPGYDSKRRYNWIRANLANVVEEAIRIRGQFP